MSTDLDDLKRQLDTKLKQHAASMGGNIRLPKKKTTKSAPKEEPVEEIYELTEKALAMADAIKFSKGVQNMMTNPVMSSVKKSTPKDNKQKEQTKQNQQETQVDPKKQKIKKDPNFTTLAPGAIRPLKKNDSVSDVVAKIYNFMLKQYHINDKKFHEDKKYNEKVAKLKETRVIELISLFGGKYQKMKPKKEKEDSFFSKILRYAIVGGVLLGFSKMALASINKKVIDALPVIPDFLSMLGIGKRVQSGETLSLPETERLQFQSDDMDAAKKSADDYLGRKMSDQEWDVLLRTTAAESSQNTTSQAMVMGTILNRAKNRFPGNPESVIMAVTEKNQFQAVTGTKNNDNKPSAKYLKGPSESEIKSMTYGAINILPNVSPQQEYFTAANPKAYGPGTDIGNLYKMQREGGTEIAGSIFNTPAPATISQQNIPVPPKPTEIPEKLPTNTNRPKSQSVSVLNNNTNVVNAGDTYLVSEQKQQYYPTLIDKQYYNYG
jgi:hypothetical protein